MDPITLASIALSYGFTPIPLVNKRPILPKWQLTTKEKALETITKLYQNRRCNNIGIVCGATSGIVVVDIDKNDGGLDLWQELVTQYGQPYTFTILTGGGGYHFYFQYDERTSQLRNGVRTINGKGIDVATTGHQVVFAGCTHQESGQTYIVLAGYEDNKPVINPMPDWLFNLLLQNQTRLDSKYKRTK